MLKLFSFLCFFGWMSYAQSEVNAGSEPLAKAPMISGKSSVLSESGASWFLLQRTLTELNEEILMKVEFLQDGVVLSNEEMQLTPSFRLKKYHWDRLQSQESADVTLTGNKLKFSYMEKGESKPKVTEIEFPDKELDSLLMPAMLSDYIVFHWVELQKDVKHIRLVVPERSDTFRFHFSKDIEENTWKLTADTFAVRMIVSPVIFKYDKDKKLIRVSNVKPPILFKEKSGKLTEKNTDIIY